MTHPGRIDDEAPVLGVLQEATGEDGMQRVSAGHRGGKVVDDEVFGVAAEERPGRLQAGDHLLQFLAVDGPQEAVPGVSQHDQQRPYRAAAARLLVLDVAQAPEVHFGHFPRTALLHPYRVGSPALPVPSSHKAMQRGIRYPAIPLG